MAGGLRSSVRTGELHRLIDPGTLDEVLNEVIQRDLGGLRPTLPESGGDSRRSLGCHSYRIVISNARLVLLDVAESSIGVIPQQDGVEDSCMFIEHALACTSD